MNTDSVNKIKTGVKCAKCNDIIFSEHRHAFEWCFCKTIFVDGGNDYFRYGGKLEDVIFIGRNQDGTIIILDKV